LLEVTRRAAEAGYDSVSMRDIARDAKMSLKTVYGFFGSKDQLIAAAHAERMDEFRSRLAERPPRGDDAEQRVKVVLRGIAGALERDEVRTRTLMRAIYSRDAAVGEARRAVTGSYTTMIDAAIGDDVVGDRRAVIETLGHVINSAILGWLHHQSSAAEVAAILDDAARALLRPR
jgi:AcrR family transcriptional regulator